MAAKCNHVYRDHDNLPILMEISPMAQVALLQTEMNSGLRLEPRIGMNSPVKRNDNIAML